MPGVLIRGEKGINRQREDHMKTKVATNKAEKGPQKKPKHCLCDLGLNTLQKCGKVNFC